MTYPIPKKHSSPLYRLLNSFFIRWKEKIASSGDTLVLSSLVLLALIGLLFLFFSGPCYKPVPHPIVVTPSPTVLPAPTLRKRSRIKPAILANPTPATFIAAAPTSTPENTPVPLPTPAGGGWRKIVFASNRADGHFYQIFIMDADGNNIERLTRSRSYDRDPHFSSNGKLIAFASNRENGIYQIYILDLETRMLRQVTAGSEDKTNPVWSPDGTQILFTLHNGRSAQLGIMNADGSEKQQLTSSYGDNHGYSFAPDGAHIAYGSSMNNRSEIFIMDLKTQESSLLVKTDETTEQGKPMFSPLGHIMVFTSDVLEHKIRQFYIYNLNYKQATRITHDNVDHNDPFISPDGSKIAYTALWNNAWNIFIMDTDGKNVQNLTQSAFDNFSPTWR